jgi:hypothetical protein
MADSLENPPATSHTAERRASIRYPLQHGCVSTDVITGPDREHFSARVLDVSTTGIALVLRRPIEPGTPLTLTIRAPNNAEQTLHVRVAHLKPRSRTEWVIGCAFAKALSEQELRAML